MAGVTGKAQIDQAVEKFVAESRYTLQERRGPIRSVINTVRLPENEGPSVNIPKYGTVTTSALTEGVDMAQAQQITDTGMVLTPSEYGAQVVLTDMMMMTVKDEFMGVASRILADSFDRQQDQTLCDDGANFSVSLGSAGTAMNIGHLMAAEAAIKYGSPAAGAGRGGEPGPGTVHVFHTPAGFHPVKKGLSGQTGGAVVQASGGTANQPGSPPDPQGFSENFMVGTVSCHTDINFNKDASDDAIGIALVPDAWILVELGPAAGIETERDASLRGTEVNYVGRWARGEYRDAWGKGMTFDSAAPTS